MVWLELIESGGFRSEEATSESKGLNYKHPRVTSLCLFFSFSRLSEAPFPARQTRRENKVSETVGAFFNLTGAHPDSTTQHSRRNLGAAVGRQGLKTRRHLHVRLPQPPQLLQMVLVAHGRAPSAKVHQILIRSFR